MLLNLLNFYIVILRSCFASELFIVPLGVIVVILVLRLFGMMGER